ncbi:MAG: CRTAC1 family protein, partial [Thermoanaerobaculia bacterium]
VDVADVDNDGDEDIFHTHYARETNTLYINDGTAMFDDVTQASGLATPSWNFTSFGTHLFDYDNDGLLDIMTVSGAVTIFSNGSRENLAQTNQLFRNLDGRQFEDVTEKASEAFLLEEVSRGAAFGDLDNDGDTDVVVFNNSEPSRLLVNQVGSDRNWLGLRLVGKATSRDMHGAWVELTQPTGPTLWRRVHTDGSYASASDPRVLFGLADRPAPATARVSWPSGLVEEFSDLPAGQYTELKEGTGRALE